MTSQDELDPRGNKSFLEHLQDLRATLLWSLALLAAGIAVGIPLAPSVFQLLKAPVDRAGLRSAEFLKVIKVTGGFTAAMRIAFWSGVIISAPFIVLTACRFIFPGLKRGEKAAAKTALFSAVVLFFAGVLVGYSLTLPVALRVMLNINRWMGTSWEWVELSDYVTFVLRLLLVFGLAFELPVVLITLGHLGIVTPEVLSRKRPYVIVGLMILAMLLTPPDPLTLLMMAVPMTALYELCILALRFKSRNTRP
ncbi:MAG: twin-arginine translocase subunit TatC [Kiritimatiellia bacterium]